MANRSTKSSKSTQSTSKATAVARSTASAKTAKSTVISQATGKSLTERYISTRQLKKPYVLAAIAVIIIALLLFRFRGVFVAAVVNGQPITRLSVIHDLEKQGGKQTLNTLISKQLIAQEATKRKIVISDNDINAEIKKIEENYKKQGQTLEDVLKTENITRQNFVEQIRIQKTIEKMLEKDVVVSTNEVKAYMEKNKANLPQGTTEKDVKDQLRSQKLNEKFQALLEDLRKNAKIQTFVNY